MMNNVFNYKNYDYTVDTEALIKIREKLSKIFLYYEFRNLSTTDVSRVSRIQESKTTRNVKVSCENVKPSEPSSEGWLQPSYVNYIVEYEQLITPYLLTLIDEILVGNFKHIFNILYPTYIYEEETNIENVNRFLSTVDTSKLNKEDLLAVQDLINKKDSYEMKESIKPYYDMVKKCIIVTLKQSTLSDGKQITKILN